MTSKKLKIELGAPEHGWLPVELRHGDFELQFMASGVSANPIDQLISGIRQVTKGISTQVSWHLEPGYYYFHFDKVGNEYRLRISVAKRNNVDQVFVYETQEKYDDLIMPFYRSIKNFSSKTILESHWPKTDETEIAKLTEVIKGR